MEIRYYQLDMAAAARRPSLQWYKTHATRPGMAQAKRESNSVGTRTQTPAALRRVDVRRRLARLRLRL
eukprot:COSAG01_NODE_67605_length_266_cov_1.173653_1_plen_67_part_10